jgi:putative NADPH-quinone reductase
VRIVAIHAHPNENSYNRALSDAYVRGARAAGAQVGELALDELDFDPILHKGYAEVQPLEPDLLRAQRLITEADHILLSFPVWWGAAPALLKGFLDRTFLPGWAFRFHDVWPLPKRLLTGRTAHVILTMDSPKLVYAALYWGSAHRSVIAGTLSFSGIGPVSTQTVSAVKYLPAWERRRQVARSEALGRKHARKGNHE